jgi:putative ABC transport system substrate-binding protein
MSYFFGNRTTQNAKRKPFILLWLVLLLAAGGCVPETGPIVVFCSPDSPRMRQALDGLQGSLALSPQVVVCVPQFGPQGREQLRRLRQGHPRLLVVLGTPALMLVAPVEKHTPVVFGLVANPFFTGAAYEPEHPEIHQENLTGIYSPPPVAAALKHGASLTGVLPWGLLYDPNDGAAVGIAATFTERAPDFGIQPLTATSAAAATDRQGLERLLARGARVLYLPPAASAARYAPLVLAWGRERKVMVVSGYPEGSHQGALLWVALDYRKLGEEVGALARRVLQGEAPQKIPLKESMPLKVAVNENLLRHWSGYPPVKK